MPKRTSSPTTTPPAPSTLTDLVRARFRELMAESFLTQEQLGAELGRDQSSMSLILRGKRRGDSLDLWAAIAKRLGHDLSELVAEAETVLAQHDTRHEGVSRSVISSLPSGHAVRQTIPAIDQLPNRERVSDAGVAVRPPLPTPIDPTVLLGYGDRIAAIEKLFTQVARARTLAEFRRAARALHAARSNGTALGARDAVRRSPPGRRDPHDRRPR